MGLLALNRLMFMQRGRLRRPIQTRNGLMTSAAKRKDSPCLQDDNSRSEKNLRYSVPSLPEDIWHCIHSLLPLRDAARSACVSRTFLSFWRCYPNLTISRETLGLEDEEYGMSYETSRDLAIKTDLILKNHAGTGVKVLKLEINDFPIFSTYRDLDRWLHISVRPGIEKLDLSLHPIRLSDLPVYNFPCSLLLNGSGKSIRHIHLSSCTFRPTAGLDCLRSLTSLDLYEVRVTDDELRCLLSSFVALEELRLVDCEELIFLKIPSLLQPLGNLEVQDCENLEVIESKAPNLSRFEYMGPPPLVQLSLGDSLQHICINGLGRGWDIVHYSRAKLPCMVPNLEVLDIYTSYLSDTLVVPACKFLHLRHLFIDGFCRPDYDHFSLVSFLDACPYLETFRLCVKHDFMEHELVLGDFSHDLRQMPGHLHSNIKDVQIIGFYSKKSIIELTCHILENATSLESLTLDASYSAILCSDSKKDMEAHKALLAVKRYILGKVPSSVELKVVDPCSRCNAPEILVQERKLVEPAQSESALEFGVHGAIGAASWQE